MSDVQIAEVIKADQTDAGVNSNMSCPGGLVSAEVRQDTLICQICACA